MHLQRGRELNTVRISLGIGTIIAAPKPRRVFEQEKLSVLTSCESRFDVYAAIGRSLHDLGQLGAFEQMRPALWEASNRRASASLAGDKPQRLLRASRERIPILVTLQFTKCE
jgi:hypothetical protein